MPDCEDDVISAFHCESKASETISHVIEEPVVQRKPFFKNPSVYTI